MPIIEKEDEIIEVPEMLPVLPLRDVVIFPGMITPLLVGRPRSLASVDASLKGDRLLLVVTQKQMNIDEPTHEDLYQMGTVVRILQHMRLVEGTMRILVEGLARGEVEEYLKTRKMFKAHVKTILLEEESDQQTEALVRSVSSQFSEYVQLNKRIPDEVLRSVLPIESFDRLVDSIAAHIIAKIEVKQQILEAIDLQERCRALSKLLAEELEILNIEKKIEGEVKSQVQKNQKEFYLHEQLKAIRKELGHTGDESTEIDELQDKIEKSGMSAEAYEVALKELDRLSRMPAMSPEATVVRNYIDTLLSLPWQVRTKDHLDIKQVKRKLDADHYGLKKVKERILEFLAVMKLSHSMKGPILCFVGPPGVGKTSLGRSIAEALGRKFMHFSLGGVRDEAEIRGHRRTYIGSMPGRIVQSLIKAQSRNPVMLLDEVDKMSRDFRGDPAAALLEVLDPEQNNSFSDHYLEVEFDLSEVMFITTANVTHTIPPALQDRMETIRLPGYLEVEKAKIARNFLLPKMLKLHGMETRNLKVSESAIRRIIQRYTRESGVRNLERELAKILRRVAKDIATAGKSGAVEISTKNLERFLGIPHYTEKEIPDSPSVGIATGLAWTSFGGDILRIEVTFMPGTGNFTVTGQLGDVMRESTQIALSYARNLARLLPLKKNFFNEMDVHIHVPEGAIPKDGPSAGIAVATALVSNFFGIPVRKDVAMTGELTLKGEVLPVGGLNEKTVAALRAGIKEVIIPKGVAQAVKELPKEVRSGLKIHIVNDMREALKIALVRPLPRLSRRQAKREIEELKGFFEYIETSLPH
ncbi:MAG: endopeptidase La [Candidatus Latescibacteria bacterium]|nr:endopeptidase La [Candidatus Latescibacterota bacterium]NIM22109.1 endopeptidase La [Candidatus Latescibacterota bacterium]NIM64659.1 endopeptidase La [Candidatus Latescibacterota bacterium]NIO01169.1 endopeptidase La [Candidatus Latescibacterota bacterium]NIO27554.1 endopeptidase La [Candidatus Latescibacterota bacterium]